jgi:hypothetical protein
MVRRGAVQARGIASSTCRPLCLPDTGGFRILGLLPEPYTLREPADAAAWSRQYVSWCAYLARRFQIHVDTSCKDWQRLYRLPHVTRTPGGTSEEREIIRDPRHIGVWQCKPTAEDLAMAEPLCKRKSNSTHQRVGRGKWAVTRYEAGEGILFHIFGGRGWLGQEIEPGKISVICPWEDPHTKGAPFDTSTVPFLPEGGDTVGWLHCSHSHCQGRNLDDVLAMFTPAELTRAREAGGLITFPQTSGRWPSCIIVQVA